MKAAFAEVNGLRTRYLHEGGQRSGPPLILLHGFFDSADTWRRNIDNLAHDRPVFAPDMVGHGFTPPVDLRGAPPHDAAVAHIGAWIDQMGWKTFDIAGCSFGALIAGLLTFERPAAVRRVVLSGSAMVFEPEGVLTQMMAAAEGGVLPMIGGDADAETLQRWMAAAIGAPAADTNEPAPGGMLSYFAQAGAAEFFQSALAAMRDPRAMRERAILHRLEAFQPPTLILWGRNDSRPWQRAAEGAARMPDARLEVLDGCGHLAHLADPARFNQLVAAFLGEASRPG